MNAKKAAALGYREARIVAGRWCGLARMMFTTALVVGIDEAGYDRRYCYEHEADARAALDVWDGFGHPPGPWIKVKGVGVDMLKPALETT